MSSVLALVRRHPVVTYVILTFALSWAYWIPMLLRGDAVEVRAARDGDGGGGDPSHAAGRASHPLQRRVNSLPRRQP